MSHTIAHDSPLSVRKAKINPEKSIDSLTLAWCEYEQQLSESQPLKCIDRYGRASAKSNAGTGFHNCTSGTHDCATVATSSTKCAANNSNAIPDERVIFINNSDSRRSAITCECNNNNAKLSRTKKTANRIRSLMPWGIPWAILVNSIIQVWRTNTNRAAGTIFDFINCTIVLTIFAFLFFSQITIHFMGCDDTFNQFVFSPIRKQDIWRFITYHFLHSGSTHLFLNVLLQVC